MCTTTSTHFTCDLSGAGGVSGATVVSDYSGANEFEAWGDVNGTLFCCESSANYMPTHVLVNGSAYSDTLTFTFSSLAYNLGSVGSRVIDGAINGGAGSDTIKGSDAVLDYSEALSGGDDSDSIIANADDDVCNGNSGDDTLFGGNGDDEIFGNDGDDMIVGGNGVDYLYGGADSDTMTGDLGDDYMFGQAGVDFMSGGAGDDNMDGGDGGDVMCGNGEGAHGDYLDDGDSTAEVTPDKLWSSVSADFAVCGNSSTLWDGSAADVGCGSTLLTGLPAQCP